MAPKSLWTRLQILLDCAVDELELAGQPVPNLTFIAPGAEVAWDDCCDGQLWVRVIRVFPANPFPAKTLELRPCGQQLAAQVAVGILRCSSGLDRLDHKSSPTADDLRADAEMMMCDQAALHRAIACCPDVRTDGDIVVDQWVPLGPLGGCYGGEWQGYYEVRLDCPEVTSPEESSV